MYVDDSGTSSLNDDTSLYVISGIIVKDDYLHWLEIELEHFKKRYFPKQCYNICY